MARKTVNQTVSAVAKKSNEVANISTIISIEVEKLIPHPKNNEDVDFTNDLELSIKARGFIGAIDVTDFGHEDGNYTIVSGHRRVEAAKKVGMKTIPCIVYHYSSDIAVREALFLGNLYRDSSRDPMLMVTRFMNYQNLELEKGTKPTKIVEGFSKATGQSMQMTYVYRSVSRCIPEVWNMIRAGKTSMSNVQNMGTLNSKEQLAVYKMFDRYIEENDIEQLTRKVAEKIINGYKVGQNYEEIMEAIEHNRPQIAGLDYPDSSITQNEGKQPETKDEPRDRNDEINREFTDDFDDEIIEPDVTKPEYDFENEDEQGSKQSNDNKGNPDLKKGKELISLCEKLDGFTGESYSFKDGKATLNLIASTIYTLTDILYEMAERKDVDEAEYKKVYSKLVDYIQKSERD